MIIHFPTGFYETVLPQEPEDSGNITFLISNTLPPRTNLIFPKIPQGIVNRKRIPKTIGLFTRRDVLGDLAFTISQSSRKEEGSNNQEFEIGQVLEFLDVPLKALEPMFVNKKTQIQHDINRLNYDALGVDADEQQLIADTSLVAHKTLSDQLNIIRQQRADAEQQVIANQKIVNDSSRTINALTIIQDTSATTDSDVDALIEKMELRRIEATAAIDIFSDLANSLASEAAILTDEIRTVGTVLI